MDDTLRRQLLAAYKIGWCDGIVGDDVRRFDYQTDDEILARILDEAEKGKESRKHDH